MGGYEKSSTLQPGCGRALAFLIASFALAKAASAQVSTPPPAVEPGRIPQQFQPPPAPPELPQIVTPAAPENVPPPGAEKVKVTLDHIEIDGATVYSQTALAALSARYIGHEIALADLFTLANEITAKYRADGYILSRAIVPAQRIGKTARITVIEGFVSDVRVEGYDSARLRAYGEKIKQSRPLTAADLERYLLLANDLAGVTARAVLSPSPDVEGGAVLTLVAEHTLIDSQFALDNHGTKYIGPWQFYLGGGVNVPTMDQRFAARYITTPSARELQYGELSFTQPLGDDGARFVLYSNYSNSRPQYTLSPFNDISQGEQASATLAYPIIRSRAENLEVRASLAVSDLYLEVNNNPALPPSSQDHLRMVRTGLNYDIADTLSGVNLVALELTRGLPSFGASANSRPGAVPDFGKLLGQVSREQDLSIIHDGVAAYGAVEFQHGDTGPLPASEQFGIGGPLFGRAYDPSDVVGDSGWDGEVELRYTARPPLVLGGWWNSYQLYTFYDDGRVSRNVASVGAPALSSFGTGVRLAFFDRVNSDIYLAKPLTRDESVSYGLPHARPWRLFMQMSVHL